MVFVAALLYAIPVMLVILAAFLRGDGPAPPDAGIDRLDERLRGRRFANETDRVHMHIKLSADGMAAAARSFMAGFAISSGCRHGASAA